MAKWARVSALVAALVLIAVAVCIASPARAMSERDIRCLAIAVYHEARGEPLKGQLAVAHVALNRGRPCQAIGPGWGGIWNTPERRYATPTDSPTWRWALTVARIAAGDRETNPVGEATHFDHKDAQPYWAKAMRRVAVIGNHAFYQERP